MAALEIDPYAALMPLNVPLWLVNLYKYCNAQRPSDRKDSRFIKDYMQQCLAVEETGVQVEPRPAAGLVFRL